MIPGRLPTFQGYVIDVRLKQFRKMKAGGLLEFIDFDSEKGLDLIEEMEEHMDAIKTYRGEKPREVADEAGKAVRRAISMRKLRCS